MKKRILEKKIEITNIGVQKDKRNYGKRCILITFTKNEIEIKLKASLKRLRQSD